jgi:hypothetical protein
MTNMEPIPITEPRLIPILEELKRREPIFHEIAPDKYPLTYALVQDATRVTRRATIWRRSSDGWKIVYHQGTIVEND